MSKQANTLSRRNFLKATAYTSALVASGLSSLSFANSASTSQSVINESVSSTVNLLNQSDKAYTLDAFQPFTLEKVHGWVVVKLNRVPELREVDSITLAAGEQRSFETSSELAPALKEKGGYIFITNEHTELDNMVPMATFDVAIV